MLGYVGIVYLNLILFLNILIACKDKIIAGKTLRSVSLRWVWLRAVLVCAESDSAQC